MNNNITDAESMVKLLEDSVLPLMSEMIKAMGEQSYRFESNIRDIKDKIEGIDNSELTTKLSDKAENQEEAFNILAKAITSFGEKLTDLIDTNNNLINNQRVQNETINEVKLAFEENTARLDTLSLVICNDYDKSTSVEDIHERFSMGDDTQENIQENAQEITPIKGDSRTIQDVLKDEIERFKANAER